VPEDPVDHPRLGDHGDHLPVDLLATAER
jgi:hypothetical protein